MNLPLVYLIDLFERRSESETALPFPSRPLFNKQTSSASSLSQCLQELGPGLAKTRKQSLRIGLPKGAQVQVLALSSAYSGLLVEVGSEIEQAGLEECSSVECGHCKQWLHLLLPQC